MRLMLLFFINILLSVSAFGQQETVYFSDAIKQHLNTYNKQSDLEFQKGDLEKGQFLFDSLVQHYLVGSKFDDYSLKNVSGGKVKLSKIKKPVFIITYASWCVLNKGEIPALNKLSKKYAKEVQFVVLFWDKKSNVKKIARKFSGNIQVCYANERYRNDSKVISTLKHTLGFPTSYFLNDNLDVVDIKRGGVQTGPKSTYLKSFNLNYELFSKRLADCMSKKDLVKEREIQLADSDD